MQQGGREVSKNITNTKSRRGVGKRRAKSEHESVTAVPAAVLSSEKHSNENDIHLNAAVNSACVH